LELFIFLEPEAAFGYIQGMNKDTNRKVHALVLCVYQNEGEMFLESICPDCGGGPCSLKVDNNNIRLDLLAGDPALNASWQSRIQEADALILMVRFMDVTSIDKLNAIHRSIPSEGSPPLFVFLFREQDQAEFKRSCPTCGQKLWVRDMDVGREGRCPNCKASFALLSQEDLIKKEITLPDAVPVIRVYQGDEGSVKSAFAWILPGVTSRIAEQAAFDEEVLKKSTIRVQIDDL